MDKQFWKLQLLKGPAILGMALTLVSTSTAIAIEPETSQENNAPVKATVSSLELPEFSEAEEVAIAPETRETKAFEKKAIASQILPEAVREVAVPTVSVPTVSVPTVSVPTVSEQEIVEQVEIPIVEFSNPDFTDNSATRVLPENIVTEVATESEELEELARAEDETNIEELLGLSTAPTQIAQMYSDRTNSNGEVLDRVNQYSNEDTNGSMGQGVPGAARFSDVSPSDWAYQALDDLVRRYDCLKGYPNGTYRGNRALSRYEFAAGLNACLQQIERLIAASTADFVTRQDLEALQRLIQEFEAELATLGTRVDNLEGRVAFLEDHQFSTTTKLSGEVIFGLTNDFGGDTNASAAVSSVGQSAFGDRVRLELNTSFTGNDRLVTRLAAGNLTAFSTGSVNNLSNTSSFAATQTFNVPSNRTGNDVYVDWLGYYFQYLNSQAYVAATGGKWSDIAPTLNPYFEDFDGGNGSLSTFGQRNSIFRVGGGSGAALSFGFTPIESILGPSTVTIGYFAGSNAATPGAGSGAFNGDYAAMGHLNANISDTFGVGLTYVHGYHASGSPIYAEGRARQSGQNGLVGSYTSNNPWVLLDNNTGGIPMVTNSYGAEFSVRPTETFVINGGVTYTSTILLGRGNADIWSYSLGVAFPDLGREGSVLGLYGGIQPTLKGIRASGVNRDRGRVDDVWHIEGFYKFQVTDNISITPGVVWVLSPNQDVRDESNIIGTVRTTFSF
jgi:hypothetical protein